MGILKMENLNPKKMEVRSFFKQRLIIGVCVWVWIICLFLISVLVVNICFFYF